MSKKNSWLRSAPGALSTAWVMACAAGLSGCAFSPVVSWQRPEPSASPIPLVEAQRYAEKARTAYRQARDGQVKATTALNSGLLGLGVLGTGLAIGKASRDALLGTAFVGASAYAFGQQNLNVQHRLIYEAGIEAIGCAKDAVQPLAMSNADQAALEAAVVALNAALLKTSSARADAVAALQAWKATVPGDDALETGADAALAASSAAIDAGLANVTSSRLLIRRAGEAGDTLVSAVERIDDAVNKAVTATLPDPSSVFKVVAGLPGFAAGIVPGSDAAITAAIAKSGAALAPLVAPKSGNLGATAVVNFDQGTTLYAAIGALNQATEGLRLALADVNGRLPTEESLRGLQTAKACGLGEVTFAIKVMPAAPRITAGADRKTSITISGGKPPYFVELQDRPVKGVSVVSPRPYESTATFEITKEAEPGTVVVNVMDARQPPSPLQVAVVISKAGAGADGAAAIESGKLAAPKSAAELADRLNAIKVFTRKDGGEFSMTSGAMRKSETLVEVALRCRPPPKMCIPVSEASQVLSDAASAPTGMAKLLKVTAASNCVCAH